MNSSLAACGCERASAGCYTCLLWCSSSTCVCFHRQTRVICQHFPPTHTHRLSVEAILHSEKRERRESARSVSEFRALLLSTMTANQCATHFLFAGGNSAARTGTHKRVDCAPELKSEWIIFRTFICIHDCVGLVNRNCLMLLSQNLKGLWWCAKIMALLI